MLWLMFQRPTSFYYCWGFDEMVAASRQKCPFFLTDSVFSLGSLEEWLFECRLVGLIDARRSPYYHTKWIIFNLIKYRKYAVN
jgi:hypothetical protein